jgi:hypothetical protein
MGRVGERRATSVKPARLNVDSNPLYTKAGDWRSARLVVG